MDTSKNNFDIIFSPVKRFNVRMFGFPKVDSAFSTISLLFGLNVDESLLRIEDKTLASLINLYFKSSIDNSRIRLSEFTYMTMRIVRNLTITAMLKSIEKLNLSVALESPKMSVKFWERLPIGVSVSLRGVFMSANATVGIWRRLFSWDYDNEQQEVEISYWDTKLLSNLDYKTGEEYA